MDKELIKTISYALSKFLFFHPFRISIQNNNEYEKRAIANVSKMYIIYFELAIGHCDPLTIFINIFLWMIRKLL